MAAYRIYITDCLKNLSESAAASAMHAGGEGKYITQRYYDILHPKPADERTGEEIFNHINAVLRGCSN